MSGISPASLRKLMDCYRNASNAYHELLAAEGLDETQSKWAHFLRSAGTVIHVLEGSCKELPSLRQWYGQEKKAAKRTPFLQYMYQARNAEEHNSLPTLGMRSQRRTIDGRGQTFTLKTAAAGITITDNGIEFAPEALESDTGQRPFQQDCTAVSIVTEIVDEKHGNRFEVPAEYDGKALDPASPQTFAEKYLRYLREMMNRVPKTDAQFPSSDKPSARPLQKGCETIDPVTLLHLLRSSPV